MYGPESVAMNANRDFNHQLAVVTGAGSGIGAEIARELSRRRAQVVVVDAVAESALAVAESIGAKAVVADVRSRDQVRELVTRLDRAPDVLITSAGGAQRRSALDVDEELFADSYQLNVGGFWRCTQEAARRAIAEQIPLSVVHIASSLYRGPAPELSHFAAAKAASITLVRCLAQELATHEIRVNAVVPGPIVTPATANVWSDTPGVREALEAKLPLGRIGEPRDVANAAVWLSSKESNWVTGTVLRVDGGLSVAD